MTKINFTKNHFETLYKLAANMLFKNDCVETKFGTVLNIVELLHTTTIESLNSIRILLNKQISNLEDKDEWAGDNTNQEKLNRLKSHKELVNFIIGYKRYILEQVAIKNTKKELEDKLNALKESQKTPEDKIKELEEQIKSLDTEEFN